jgi:hypothetical protein
LTFSYFLQSILLSYPHKYFQQELPFQAYELVKNH